MAHKTDYQYLVQWDNQSYLRFTAGKFLSMAELQFLIWHHLANTYGMQMPPKLADKAMANYSIIIVGIARNYWEQYPTGHII